MALRPVCGSADELLAELADWEAAASPDPLEVATSGSTGRPKRVVLSRAAMRASADASHARLGGAGQWVLSVPPTYVAGLQVLFRSVRAGTRPLVGPAGALSPGSGRSYVSLVPTQLHRALRDERQVAVLTAFDAVLVGGGPLRAADRDAAEAAGIPVVHTYGMSETCGGCVYDGVPLDGVGVKVDRAGEVWLSGPVLSAAYAGEPDRTAQVLRDGWLRTGDLGAVDDDGRLRIVGRLDDVINSGGVKVPPVAVEDMLAVHPGVGDVAVVGVPDPEWGERVTALVVPRPDRPLPGLDVLRDLVAPRAWAPRELLESAVIPRLGNGKVDRQAVRRLAAR